MNEFVMNNAKETMKQTRLLPLTEGVKKQLHDFFIHATIDKPVWNSGDELLTSMKKAYASVLLKGCISYTGNKKDQILKEIAIVEKNFMTEPVVRAINSIISGFESMYDTFIFAREEMLKYCPDLLEEIVNENYERIWPGYTDSGENIANRFIKADNFYEPIVNDILEKWAGCEAGFSDAIPDTPTVRYIHIAITGLLRYGKSGYFGIEFRHMMATIGIYTNTFPSVLRDGGKEGGHYVAEIYSKNNSENGLHSLLPSMAEMVDIFSSFDKQCPHY